MRGLSAKLALLVAGAAFLSLAAAEAPSHAELDEGMSFLSTEEFAQAASGSTGATGAEEPEVETSEEDPELKRLEAKVADALKAQQEAEAAVMPYREKASKIRERLVATLEGVHSSLTEASAADEARQHEDVLGKLSSSTDAIDAAAKIKEEHSEIAGEMISLEKALQTRKNETSLAQEELKAYRERHLIEATKRYKISNAKLQEIAELLQARLALAQQATTAVEKAEEHRMPSAVVMARMDASRKASAAAKATQEWKDAQLKYVEKAQQAMLHERAKLYGEPEEVAESKEPPQDGSEDPLIRGLSEAAAEAEADSQAAREQLAAMHGSAAAAPPPKAQIKAVERENAAEAKLSALMDGSGSSFEGPAAPPAAAAAAQKQGEAAAETKEEEAVGATGTGEEAAEKSALEAASEAADKALEESATGPSSPHLKKIAGTLDRIEDKLGIIHSAVSGSDATGGEGPTGGGETGATGGEETGATGGEETGATGGEETGATGGEETGATGGEETGATGGEEEEEKKEEEKEKEEEEKAGEEEAAGEEAGEEKKAGGEEEEKKEEKKESGAGGAGGKGGADGFRPATSVPVGSLGGSQEEPELQMVPTIEHKKNIEHHDSCEETGEGCSPSPGNPESLPSGVPLGDNVAPRGVSTGSLQATSGLRGAMRS